MLMCSLVGNRRICGGMGFGIDFDRVYGLDVLRKALFSLGWMFSR